MVQAVLWGIGVAGTRVWDRKETAADGHDAIAPGVIAHPGAVSVGSAVGGPGAG